jgi:hypothetical protein
MHPPNIWLIVEESKSVIKGISNLISLLNKLVTSVAWLSTPGVGNIEYMMVGNTRPINMNLHAARFVKYFNTFMTGYISNLNTLIADVKKTSHNLGVISGYYANST